MLASQFYKPFSPSHSGRAASECTYFALGLNIHNKHMRQRIHPLTHTHTNILTSQKELIRAGPLCFQPSFTTITKAFSLRIT